MIGYIFILKTVNEISKFSFLLNKVSQEAVWIGVSATPECEHALRATLGECGIKYNLVINTEEFSDYYKIDQFLPHIKNGWTYVHEVGQPFRDDVNRKVKKFIEIGGKFALISDECEAINDTCFYNLIYKMLRGNRPEPNQIINFYDKVGREDQSMIRKWSELDELYDNQLE